MIADALRTPPGPDALSGLPGAAPLVSRRRAMADPTLGDATRQHAAYWLRLNGQPLDRAAAQKFLTSARQAPGGQP